MPTSSQPIDPPADGSPRREHKPPPVSLGKTLWFLSPRNGATQIWRILADGGEAEQVTREPLDVSNLIVSPDGKYLAFSMEVFSRPRREVHLPPENGRSTFR